MFEPDWIEVAYVSCCGKQALIRLEYLPMTAEQAIERSGILDQFPEIDLAVNKVGVFSQPIRLSQRLKAGNRVEIYRDLLVNPKQARRARAKKAIKSSS